MERAKGHWTKLKSKKSQFFLHAHHVKTPIKILTGLKEKKKRKRGEIKRKRKRTTFQSKNLLS